MEIARLARVGDAPLYTPYGYLVSEDGTVYSLTEQFVHGTILALLFPKIAKKAGYDAPDDDYCVYYYQRFELDNQDNFPVIRVSISLSGTMNISKGSGGATIKQTMALSLIFKEQGINLSEQVFTEYGEMTARKALLELQESNDERYKRISGDAVRFRDEF